MINSKESNDKFLKILRQSQRDQLKVMAWDLEGQRLITYDLRIKETSKASGEILLTSYDDTIDWSNIEKLVKGSGLMNFFIEEHSLLFKSELLTLEKDFLVIKYPRFWKFEDRRQKERYISLNSIQFEVERSHKKRSFKVFDLSFDGLSIVVSAADSFPFSVGEKINDCLLKLQGKKISCSVEVINGQKVKPYQYEKIAFTGRRYGFKFLDEMVTLKKYLEEIKKNEVF